MLRKEPTGGHMARKKDRTFRVGVDVGGTFTDIVLLGKDGSYAVRKVLSTPEDYSRAITGGIDQLLAAADISSSAVEEIVHGTTIATNTIFEGTGAKTALITTRGFRDVLELRRLRVPELYSLRYRPPTPLVERRLRLEVDERIGSHGEVVRPLDEKGVLTAAERIVREGAEAIAVTLIHSYRNPGHERRVGQILKERLPEAFCSLSVDVLPEIREYERTSTTVVNAYLGPRVQTYLDALARRLSDRGIQAPLHIMQSNGGLMSAVTAGQKPAWLVESGPAAGVIAAQELGRRLGLDDLITFDMGGTTAKASLIEDGRPTWTTEYEVGAGISLSSRLTKGAGHAVKVPVIDLAEVGAGGGSVVWIDSGGAIKVGPESAGAMPGPLCYGLGGTKPTVTDANLVLGYLNAQHLASGTVRLKAELARGGIAKKVAQPLGIDPLQAAYGVYAVANATMTRAIKAVSTYRGRDPRKFALLAFGGNGPVHAASLARGLGIGQVIVPQSPGLFSALGLLEARPEVHFVQTYFMLMPEVDEGELNSIYGHLATRASETLAGEGLSLTSLSWLRSADLRYAGQAYEISVPVPLGRVDRHGLSALVDRFHQEHERTYGYSSPKELVELVNVRLTARVEAGPTDEAHPVPSEPSRAGGHRPAYFGPDHGLQNATLVKRSDLAGRRMAGPLILDEYDATTVVPPGCGVSLDNWNNLVIDVR
jgi:N-methylhydantoinase A